MRYPTNSMLLLVLAAACGPEDGAVALEERPVTVSERVTVIDVVDSVVVEPSRLLFPRATHARLLELEPGQVVIGDRQRSSLARGDNPNGFLRKVSSVSIAGDQIVISTESASLSDVIDEGRRYLEIRPSASDSSGGPVESPNHAPSYEPQSGASFSPLTIATEFSGLQLGPFETVLPVSAEPEIAAKTSVKVNVGKGKFAFTPTLGLLFDVKDKKLRELEASLEGNFVVELSTEATAELSLSTTAALTEDLEAMVTDALLDWKPALDFNKKLGTLSYPLPTVWIPAPVPIPVVSNLIFELNLSCHSEIKGSATLKFGTASNATIRAGARYFDDGAGGSWTPIFESSGFQPSTSQPALIGALSGSFVCEVKPTLSLIFYGVAGPYIYAKGSATAGLTSAQGCVDGVPADANISLALSAEAGFGFGGKIGLFVPNLGVDFSVASVDLSLFEQAWALGSWPLWSGVPPFPMVDCSASTGSGGGSGSGGTGSGGGSGGSSGGSGGSSGGTGGSTTSVSCGQLAAQNGWAQPACEWNGNNACNGQGPTTNDCVHCCEVGSTSSLSCGQLAAQNGWAQAACEWNGNNACNGQGPTTNDCVHCCEVPSTSSLSCGQLAAQNGWAQAACEWNGNSACNGQGPTTYDCVHCCQVQ